MEGDISAGPSALPKPRPSRAQLEQQAEKLAKKRFFTEHFGLGLPKNGHAQPIPEDVELNDTSEDEKGETMLQSSVGAHIDYRAKETFSQQHLRRQAPTSVEQASGSNLADSDTEYPFFKLRCCLATMEVAIHQPNNKKAPGCLTQSQLQLHCQKAGRGNNNAS